MTTTHRCRSCATNRAMRASWRAPVRAVMTVAGSAVRHGVASSAAAVAASVSATGRAARRQLSAHGTEAHPCDARLAGARAAFHWMAASTPRSLVLNHAVRVAAGMEPATASPAAHLHGMAGAAAMDGGHCQWPTLADAAGDCCGAVTPSTRATRAPLVGSVTVLATARSLATAIHQQQAGRGPASALSTPRRHLVAGVVKPTPLVASARTLTTSSGPAGGLRLPARPKPVVFTPAGFDDAAGAPMRVATLEDGSPFFIDDFTWRQLTDWASGEVTSYFGNRKVVVLAGPIMAGKTALLTLLPRMLAPHSSRKPVVFEFAFKAGEKPREAVLRLAVAAAAKAAELGFRRIDVPARGEEAWAVVGLVVRDLAEGIAAAGGELILLLDEVQAPLLAAESNEDAEAFACKLQAIADKVWRTSRIAFTGSSLVTLLNHVRLLRAGYTLWEAMTRVHIGATPSAAAAEAMAAAIISARSKDWSPAAAAAVTPDLVVGLLSGPAADAEAADAEAAPAPRCLAPRPALVARLADQIASAVSVRGASNVEAVAQAAALELSDTLVEAARVDTAVALPMLGWLPRMTMRHLALDLLDRRALTMRLSSNHRIPLMLETLCQPDTDLALIPPYGVAFSTLADDEGARIVEWVAGRWRLKEPVRQALALFAERHAMLIRDHNPTAIALSTTVLETMAADGHGVPTGDLEFPKGLRAVATLRELAALPAVRAIVSVLRDQEKAGGAAPAVAQSLAAFDAHVKAEADAVSPPGARADAAAFMAVSGLHLLAWLHHIEPRAFIANDALVAAGLTGSRLDRWSRFPLERNSAELQLFTAPCRSPSESAAGACGVHTPLLPVAGVYRPSPPLPP